MVYICTIYTKQYYSRGDSFCSRRGSCCYGKLFIAYRVIIYLLLWCTVDVTPKRYEGMLSYGLYSADDLCPKNPFLERENFHDLKLSNLHGETICTADCLSFFFFSRYSVLLITYLSSSRKRSSNIQIFFFVWIK